MPLVCCADVAFLPKYALRLRSSHGHQARQLVADQWLWEAGRAYGKSTPPKHGALPFID